MMMRHMWWLAVAGLACGAAAIAVGTIGADAAPRAGDGAEMRPMLAAAIVMGAATILAVPVSLCRRVFGHADAPDCPRGRTTGGFTTTMMMMMAMVRPRFAVAGVACIAVAIAFGTVGLGAAQEADDAWMQLVMFAPLAAGAMASGLTVGLALVPTILRRVDRP